MHFSYFNSRSNPKKINNKLILDDIEYNYTKSKNNILFDKFVENITKKNNISSNENTQEINSSMSSKILKAPNIKSYFKTESNQIKSNSINYLKDSILVNKKLNNFINKKNKLKINLYNNNKLLFNDLNKNNKYNKIPKLLDSEKESIYDNNCNNNDNLLKIKLKDFILSSKELFNKENKFNYKMKRIIQNLRTFNHVNKNSTSENKLNMPKIKDNINHNCCFS